MPDDTTTTDGSLGRPDGRDPKTGRLVRGHSIHPGRGRTWRGGTMTRAEAIAQLIEPHKQEIIAKAIEMAKLGEPRAQQLVLSYLTPPPRPEDAHIHVPGLAEAASLQAKAEAVLAAAAAGQITIAQADRVLSMLATYIKAISVDALEQRLAEVERAKGLLATNDTERAARVTQLLELAKARKAAAEAAPPVDADDL